MNNVQLTSTDPQLARSIIDAIKSDDCDAILRLFHLNPAQKQAHTYFAGATWLGYAAGLGRIKAVKALVLAGVDLNQGSARSNAAPICKAAGDGHIEIVEYLIASGAKLDTATSVSNPLICAVTDWRHADDQSIVKMLLQAGIDSTLAYPYSGRTKTKKPLDATAKALLFGTPVKAGTIAAWNARGDEERMRELLDAAMVTADTHLERYKYGSKKLAEMSQKREASLRKALNAAMVTEF